MGFTARHSWINELDTLRQLSSNGETFVAIGEYYGVSKQRIKQIFQKHKIPHIGLQKKKIEAETVWKKKWGDKQDTGLYASQRAKYRGKKANALRSGIEFSIEFGEIVWNTHCPILGLELDFFAEKTQENSPSFDRIDPNKGYVAGNVQIVSWRANRIKNDGSSEEHRKIAEYLRTLEERLLDK